MSSSSLGKQLPIHPYGAKGRLPFTQLVINLSFHTAQNINALNSKLSIIFLKFFKLWIDFEWLINLNRNRSLENAIMRADYTESEIINKQKLWSLSLSKISKRGNYKTFICSPNNGLWKYFLLVESGRHLYHRLCVLVASGLKYFASQEEFLKCMFWYFGLFILMVRWSLNTRNQLSNWRFSISSRDRVFISSWQETGKHSLFLLLWSDKDLLKVILQLCKDFHQSVFFVWRTISVKLTSSSQPENESFSKLSRQHSV